MTKALDSGLNTATPTSMKGVRSLALLASVVLMAALAGCLVDAPGPNGDAYTSATSTEEQVPSPDYSVGLGGLAVRTDANQVVTAATGAVDLIEGSQAGEFYVIDADKALGSTFASIDAAYMAGSWNVVAPKIPVESFTLVERTLPTVRNLIIVHAVNGVKAYKVIRINFAGATS